MSRTATDDTHLSPTQTGPAPTPGGSRASGPVDHHPGDIAEAQAADNQIYWQLEHFVLASDLDGTLIDPNFAPHESDPSLRAFADALRATGRRLTLWFNSSRPIPSQRESLELVPHLPLPQYLIGAMGTEIQDAATGERVEAYGREQFGDWPRDRVDAIARDKFGLEPHPPHLQTAFKASYDLPDPSLAAAIEGEIAAQGIEIKVVVSSGRDLDLLPPAAGKASAIRWLCGHLGLPQEAVLVSGDSANDLDMYQRPFRGIVVSNGHAELKALRGPLVYHARGRCSAGVREGLIHFGVLPEVDPPLHE